MTKFQSEQQYQDLRKKPPINWLAVTVAFVVLCGVVKYSTQFWSWFQWDSASMSKTISVTYQLDDRANNGLSFFTEAIKVRQREGNQWLVSLDMADYDEAHFDFTLHPDASGWCMNIGNSPSNNGWGGDGNDTLYDAEMQILDGALMVYGNDTASEEAREYKQANAFQAGNHYYVTISQGRVAWGEPKRREKTYTSPSLFDLKPHETAQGKPQNDSIIYAAFNRVIAHNAERTGNCFDDVKISLSRGEAAQ